MYMCIYVCMYICICRCMQLKYVYQMSTSCIQRVCVCERERDVDIVHPTQLLIQ